MIYPSCSEGGGGCVITCMHAAMIPIVSYESSVDVGDFGFVLKESTIDEIKREARRIAEMPVSECHDRSRRAWEFARKNHTRDKFALDYKNTIMTILDKYKK